MKTMVTLSKLLEEVENENLDPQMTLIDAGSLAILDDDYSIDSDQSDLDDQENN